MHQFPPSRQKEISEYMSAHNWVAEYNPKSDLWAMCREVFPYSDGPFEVLAMASTLEEAFDKARMQELKLAQ